MSAKRFNGDILSALSSSALEYSSASGGLHSLSETVYLQSLSLLGLISSFHYRISYIVIIYFGMAVIGRNDRLVKTAEARIISFYCNIIMEFAILVNCF